MTVQLFAFKLFFAWHALEVSPAPAGVGTVSAFGIEDDRGVGDGDWSPTAYKEHAGVVLTEAAVAKKIGSNPRALAAAPASLERRLCRCTDRPPKAHGHHCSRRQLNRCMAF